MGSVNQQLARDWIENDRKRRLAEEQGSGSGSGDDGSSGSSSSDDDDAYLILYPLSNSFARTSFILVFLYFVK